MALKPDKTSPLQMTPGEICGMFREAKNKIKQIAILAQVNATSKGRIIDILVDNGAELTPAVIDQFGWAETKEKYYAKSESHAGTVTEDVEMVTVTAVAEAEPAADYEQQPDGGQLPEAEEEREPVPAPMTVGALRDQLFGLPEDAPVLLGGSSPIRSVTFVREFNAARGRTVSQVMID